MGWSIEPPPPSPQVRNAVLCGFVCNRMQYLGPEEWSSDTEERVPVAKQLCCCQHCTQNTRLGSHNANRLRNGLTEYCSSINETEWLLKSTHTSSLFTMYIKLLDLDPLHHYYQYCLVDLISNLENNVFFRAMNKPDMSGVCRDQWKGIHTEATGVHQASW